jgi:hypothetical protein
VETLKRAPSSRRGGGPQTALESELYNLLGDDG